MNPEVSRGSGIWAGSGSCGSAGWGGGQIRDRVHLSSPIPFLPSLSQSSCPLSKLTFLLYESEPYWSLSGAPFGLIPVRSSRSSPSSPCKVRLRQPLPRREEGNWEENVTILFTSHSNRSTSLDLEACRPAFLVTWKCHHRNDGPAPGRGLMLTN